MALAEAIATGAPPDEETAHTRETLLDAGFDSVDFVELCDAQTLATINTVIRPARALAAVQLGRARLIDNVAVMPKDRVR